MEESDFKLKRSVNKAVVFQTQKKEDSPIKLAPSQQGTTRHMFHCADFITKACVQTLWLLCLDVEDVELQEQSESSSDEDMYPDSNDEENSTASSSTESFKTQTGKTVKSHYWIITNNGLMQFMTWCPPL